MVDVKFHVLMRSQSILARAYTSGSAGVALARCKLAINLPCLEVIPEESQNNACHNYRKKVFTDPVTSGGERHVRLLGCFWNLKAKIFHR
jgi:hypothetical protein